MKNLSVKLLSVMLTVIILLTAAPLSGFVGLDFSTKSSALDTTGQCGNDVYWYFEESTGTLTISGTGAMYNYYEGESPFYYRHPLPYNNYPFLYYNSGVKSVNIESGVTSIGDYAFFGCTGLTDIAISDSVMRIGDYAFYYNIGPISITIPDSVISIGSEAFYHVANIEYNGTASGSPWGAKSLNGYVDYPFVYSDSSMSALLACPYACRGETIIPLSVTSIGDCAFEYCTALTNITIPDSVTSIGNYAFLRVTNIEYYGAADGSPWGAKSLNGYIEYPLVFSDSSKSALLACTAAYQGDITIPDSVTSIGYEAFSGCSGLTSVTIGIGVTSIGINAFWGCEGLSDVYYYGSEADWQAITIDESNNDSLLNAEIHYNYNASIITGQCGENVYWTLNETTGALTISGTGDMYDYDQIHRIYSPFYGKNVKSVVIESGVTSVGDYLFYYHEEMTSLTLPDTVTKIGECAFQRCMFPSITLPQNLEIIKMDAFLGCWNITSLTIPNSVTSIGGGAFADCHGLTSLSLGSGVQSIGKDAFASCQGLTDVTIPASVQSMGTFVFERCNNLANITVAYRNTAYSSLDGVLFDKNKTELIQYPCANTAASFVYNGSTYYNVPESVVSIGRCAFMGNTTLNGIYIPESVESVGDSAFLGCNVFEDVYYGGSPSGWQAISFGINNQALVESPIRYAKADEPASKCGDNVYYSFDSATGTLTISGTGAMYDYQYAVISPFYQNTEIKTVIVENGVTSIGDSAFEGCSQIRDVTFGSDVTVIGNRAFFGCSALEEITIPDSVTIIGTGAFACCGLEAVSIGSGVEYIYQAAFAECSDLQDVYYLGSETDWAAISIDVGNDPLLGAEIHYNYNPNALEDALANVPEVLTCFSDDSAEELRTVLEEIYAGTENLTPQELEDLVARLNEAIANLEIKTHEVNVPEGCTSSQTEVEGVNYKLATITAPATNANGDKFVYWTDSYGNIVSTYRTYRFYVGNDAGYTPVYASAADYDQMKADALITSRVIDVKNNRDGNLVFLAEHSVSSSTELIGHGMIITTDASSANEDDLIRGSYNDEIIDFQAQTTKNSKTGMIQVCANVEGDTVWARTYVVDAEGVAHYGQIQSYDVSNLVSTHGEEIILDSVELIAQNGEEPVEEEPAEEQIGIFTMLLNFIRILIQNFDVILKSIISLVK